MANLGRYKEYTHNHLYKIYLWLDGSWFKWFNGLGYPGLGYPGLVIINITAFLRPVQIMRHTVSNNGQTKQWPNQDIRIPRKHGFVNNQSIPLEGLITI